MEKEIARPINDGILPEPIRTEPLKLIEPELPIEKYVKENVSAIEDFLKKNL